jgi:hypothetical protein
LEMAFLWISTRFKPDFNFFKFQFLSKFHYALFHHNGPFYSSI